MEFVAQGYYPENVHSSTCKVSYVGECLWRPITQGTPLREHARYKILLFIAVSMLPAALTL